MGPHFLSVPSSRNVFSLFHSAPSYIHTLKARTDGCSLIPSYHSFRYTHSQRSSILQKSKENKAYHISNDRLFIRYAHYARKSTSKKVDCRQNTTMSYAQQVNVICCSNCWQQPQQLYECNDTCRSIDKTSKILAQGMTRERICVTWP